MKEKIERFLDVKVATYFTDNTVKNYRIDLEQLNEYMTKELGNNWITKVTNDDMEYYISKLVKQGYELTTVNRKIASASKFFKYAVIRGWINKNPMNGIDLFKPNKKKKDTLSIDEIRMIIDESYKKTQGERGFEFSSARNRFIIALLTTTGLRVGELINADLSNLQKVDGGYMLHIDAIDVKNKIDKRVPIANKTLEYFEEYMSIREKNGYTKSNKMIISRTQKPMTRNGVDKVINKYVDRCGITDRNITPHSFRHTCTSLLRQNGVDTSLIYSILGWKEGIMATYTDDISVMDQRKIICCNLI